MPFLRGSLGFERFAVTGFEADQFAEEHIEILSKFAAGQFETDSTENVQVGFLGGDHLFDQEFDLDKNVINNALHCSVRIDTNVIPAAIRAAWLQIELAGRAKDSETGFVSKAGRKEAKEAVEQRCEVEAASGKYRKMQTVPFLWDIEYSQLYFGGTQGNASGHCLGLLERAFEVEFSHIGAGAIAHDWAVESERFAELDDLMPADFVSGGNQSSHIWTNEFSQAPDFLGNEFLMWLWWMTENHTDTIALPSSSTEDDDSESALSDAVVMFAKTLSLDCPKGETGKETISAESPVQLPEAMAAIRCGKLPRKAGMTIISDGRQFDLVLAAESFGISGAKIHLEEEEEFEDEDRIDAIRLLSDTTDQLFYAFLERRTSDQWKKEMKEMTRWLGAAPAIAKVA
jgi:hypothetical protein